MWPQKWKASPLCVRSAAVRKPPPATPRSSLPMRARKPRRELDSATDSLSRSSGTHRARRVAEEALELEERVERPLGEHLAVAREHDRVGASRDREGAPGLGVGLLVEELELDVRVVRDQPQRGF